MSKKRKTRAEKANIKRDFTHVEASLKEEKEKDELVSKMYEVETVKDDKGETKRVEKSFLRSDLTKIGIISIIFFLTIVSLYIADREYNFLVDWSDLLMNWLLGR